MQPIPTPPQPWTQEWLKTTPTGRKISAGCAGLAVVLILSCVIWLCAGIGNTGAQSPTAQAAPATSTATPHTPALLFTLRGDGDQKSETFHVSAGTWQISYQCQPQAGYDLGDLTFTVHNGNGTGATMFYKGFQCAQGESHGVVAVPESSSGDRYITVTSDRVQWIAAVYA